MHANERQEHEAGKTPFWLQRAAEICDEVEAEQRLAGLLSRMLGGWPQNETADAAGNPLSDRAYDTDAPARHTAEMRLRSAGTAAEIHAALRQVPLSVLRGLRRAADEGTVPAIVQRYIDSTSKKP